MDQARIFINKRFLEHADSPIFVKDTLGVYRYCNPAFANYLGHPKEDILGKTAYEIFPKELADIYTARDKALFEKAAQADFDHNSMALVFEENDGIFNKSILYNDDNSIAGFLCMISLHKIEPPHESAVELRELTAREQEVFSLLIKGQSVKVMARELNISPHTIADHLKVIYKKLGVHSKNEAIYKGLHLFMTHPWQLHKLEENL